MKRIIAIILAVLFCVGLLAACGDSETKATVHTFPGGTNQTWGEITVYVPTDMTMYSGDGFKDPENPKMVTLYENANKANYIQLQIVDSEAVAETMVESEKRINKKYDPMKAAFLGDIVQWKGIVYDAGESHCLVFSASVGGKVYFMKSAGYRFADEGNLPQVLNSIR